MDQCAHQSHNLSSQGPIYKTFLRVSGELVNGALIMGVMLLLLLAHPPLFRANFHI